MKKKKAQTKKSKSPSPKKKGAGSTQRTPDKALRPKGKKTTSKDNVVSLILHDHVSLKKLIKTLKSSELKKGKKKHSLEEFVFRLTNHAKAEERSLYVEMLEYKDLRGEAFEGETEHAIADKLVNEINSTPDDDKWNAKVKVLAELVEHHIQEEEEDLLPEVKEKMAEKILQSVGLLYLKIRIELDKLKGAKA